MKKICPLCGTENEENARFCKECNEPLYNIEGLSKENEKETEVRKRKRLRQELMELLGNPKSNLDLINKYQEEVDKIDNIMLNRNLEGKALEKEGKIDEAIKLYEKNIKEEFDGNFPYDRLAIIYSKKVLLDDEMRVLERAIRVFENVVYKDRSDRLPKIEKFKNRLEKIKKRSS